MSILIKGMEMPTSCDDCPLGDSLHCQVLPSVPALWAEYTNAVREKRMHSDCPLAPVPPHGRLIDADALYGTIEASKDETIGHTTFKDTVLLNIRGMPTIIEAEEGE